MHVALTALTTLALVACGTEVASPAGQAGSGTVGPLAVGTRLADRQGYYPRVVRLAHNGSANGRLVATFESIVNGQQSAAFYQSTDDGASWQLLSELRDATPPRNCCSVLYEVPQTLGSTSAGTLFWATSVGTDQTPRTATAIKIYKSTDQGRTWTSFSTPVTGNTGLWEPEFTVDASGRLVMFFSSEEYKGSGYNQLLAHRVSTDGGASWGGDVIDVGVADNTRRPGMAVVRKLPNGTYLMSYEVCGWPGTHDCVAQLRTSPNGSDWGDRTWLGYRPQTGDGHFFAHAPTIAWAPDGSANGKVLLVGQVLKNSDGSLAANNGRAVLVQGSNGAENVPWTEMTAPVQSVGAGDNPCVNYSSALLPSANGSKLLELATDFENGTCKTYFGTGALNFPVSGATYRLVNEQSQQCLDVANGSTAINANVQQYTCNNLAPQNWLLLDKGAGYFTLTSQQSNLCLDDAFGSTAAGANVQQYTCNSLAPQNWRAVSVANGYFKVLNQQASGLALDVDRGSTTPGANVQLYTDNGFAPQHWRFERR
ncbi:RICIN domain-containing protein [Deinococcus aetherius]|nr:RICIN domain-containing protein [Deinococcus aetherius]